MSKIFKVMLLIWIVVMIANVIAMSIMSIVNQSGVLPYLWVVLNTIFMILFLLIPTIGIAIINRGDLMADVRKILNNITTNE